jgi:hypothetical protein
MLTSTDRHSVSHHGLEHSSADGVGRVVGLRNPGRKRVRVVGGFEGVGVALLARKECPVRVEAMTPNNANPGSLYADPKPPSKGTTTIVKTSSKLWVHCECKATPCSCKATDELVLRNHTTWVASKAASCVV